MTCLLRQASSPDEEALVQGAAYLGYRLVSRTTDTVKIEHHGKRWTYDVLVVLEFNSDRKRMSIICRTPQGKVMLYTKGADTIMLARMAPGQEKVEAVKEHLVSWTYTTAVLDVLTHSVSAAHGKATLEPQQHSTILLFHSLALVYVSSCFSLTLWQHMKPMVCLCSVK